MKIMLAIIFLIGFVSAGKGQYMCPPDSLRYFEGKIITVCSDVTGTYVTKSENKTTFINFGDFPQQLFTVVIYEEDLANFSYDPAVFLKGKNVCVTGDVRMYDSGPEIIVETEEQIRIP